MKKKGAKMTTLKFPDRLFGFGYKVEMTLPKKFGGSSRLWLRNIARKKLPKLYFQKIVINLLPDTGIKIDNLGKWLFGVEGYKGHLRTMFPYGDSETISVEIPADSPKEAKDFLQELKKLVENL